jgi:hypothetical protein
MTIDCNQRTACKGEGSVSGAVSAGLVVAFSAELPYCCEFGVRRPIRL